MDGAGGRGAGEQGAGGRGAGAVEDDEGAPRADGHDDALEVLPDAVLRVLAVVEQVPAARVLTYGDVAELVGGLGPRRVGSILARYGSDVPWWRVLRADGTAAPPVLERALEAYRREGTPLRADGRRVDLDLARWDGA